MSSNQKETILLKTFLRNLLMTGVIMLLIFMISGHVGFAGFIGFLTLAAMYGI